MVRDKIRNIIQEVYPAERIIVDYVPEGKNGDYTTNLALRLASNTGQPAMKIAEEAVQKIKDPIIEEIIIYPPGFLNFVLRPEYLLNEFQKEVKLDIGRGTKVNVEFVSANPTGPINIVSGRAAAFGDALVRLLNYVGYEADAEYYVNDGGHQIELLTESIKQRMNQFSGKEFSIPDDGYHGEYLIPLAQKFLSQNIQNTEQIKDLALSYFIDLHQTTLKRFGVTFKNWIRESTIRSQGYVERVLRIFEERNLTFKQAGALFFKTSMFGDNRDRVIVTKDGRFTYLLPDIAYHLNKIERNYQQLITILGPDHLGQVKSLSAGLRALGKTDDILKVIIIQEVKLKKDGVYLSMSKRAGTFLALDELLTSIPLDVARFFLLMRSSSQHLDFDLDLALKESEENPVYYVQYAHARIKSILKHGQEKGIAYPEHPDLRKIKAKEELALIKQILKFNEVVEDAAGRLEPYLLTYYLIELARIFHNFYQKQRVITEDTALSQARLYLVNKAAETIKKGLGLLGVSCPQRM